MTAVAHLVFTRGGRFPEREKVERAPRSLLDPVEMADAAAAGKRRNALLLSLLGGSGPGTEEKENKKRKGEALRHYSRTRLKR
jgi:hypothetical protein